MSDLRESDSFAIGATQPLPFLLLMVCLHTPLSRVWPAVSCLFIAGRWYDSGGVHCRFRDPYHRLCGGTLFDHHGPFAYVRNPLYIGNHHHVRGVGIMSNGALSVAADVALVWFGVQYSWRRARSAGDPAHGSPATAARPGRPRSRRANASSSRSVPLYGRSRPNRQERTASSATPRRRRATLRAGSGTGSAGSGCTAEGTPGHRLAKRGRNRPRRGREPPAATEHRPAPRAARASWRRGRQGCAPPRSPAAPRRSPPAPAAPTPTSSTAMTTASGAAAASRCAERASPRLEHAEAPVRGFEARAGARVDVGAPG